MVSVGHDYHCVPRVGESCCGGVGREAHDRLGYVNSESDAFYPGRVSTLDSGIDTVSARREKSLARQRDGSLFCWMKAVTADSAREAC